jgi:YihY family inner membrane protein
VGFGSTYRRFDRFQRGHRWLGLLLAVRQKYSDDQGSFLAATIAYYGFLSLFPLLLVGTTVLGYALRGHPGLERSIVDSALSQLPVIGRQLRTHSLAGNGLALAIGLATAVWAGMGVFLAAENAMNHLWGVPFKQRPDFFRARLRALAMLALLGLGALGATVLAALGTAGSGLGATWEIPSVLLGGVLDFGLFWLVFRALTAKAVAWSDLWIGAAIAAVAWVGLQSLGGWYVGHVLQHASDVYGTFALVIALLAWIYLGAQLTLLAAEVNVVVKRGLWPRSFSVIVEQPPTAGDKRALTQRGKVEERRQDERVEVDFPARR